jgi:hypothetical protein
MRALLLLACLAAPLGAQDADAEFRPLMAPLTGVQPAHWRVTWTSHPATEALVSWSTAEAGTNHRVHYDVVPRAGVLADYAFVRATHRDGAFTRSPKDAEPGAHYHHARLLGLLPSTTYWFVVESDGAVSRELYFTTAPADARPISLLVGGDSRTGWRERCAMNRMLARLAGENDDVLALIHGGDYVMLGDRFDDWTRWLSHHELTVGDDGRVLPVVPTRGNHDFGAVFGEVFDAPGGDRDAYYRTRLSGDVSLLTLNTNISAGGDQLTWLEENLAAARAESRWLLTSYHRPLYPAIKTPAAAKPFWTPVFDRFDVDLALESDGHCIKRTMPIRGDEPAADGVVYVGEGGLGVPQRTPRRQHWYLQPPAIVDQGHHVMRLDVSEAALRIRILVMPELRERFAPDDFRVVVAPYERWRYLAGADPAGDWAAPEFDDSFWAEGDAGFGFGDDDDVTVLDDMHHSYSRVYLRRDFDAALLDGAEELALICNYDDGFIAYLNGVEVARAEIESGRGADAEGIGSHEAFEPERFPLAGWRELLRPGRNVLAIEGHNQTRISADFTLDPWLAADRLSSPATEVPAPVVFDDHTLRPRAR